MAYIILWRKGTPPGVGGGGWRSMGERRGENDDIVRISERKGEKRI